VQFTSASAVKLIQINNARTQLFESHPAQLLPVDVGIAPPIALRRAAAHARAKEQGSALAKVDFKLLQAIANGLVSQPSGCTRPMRRHEMIDAARELCEQLSLTYSTNTVHEDAPQRRTAGR